MMSFVSIVRISYLIQVILLIFAIKTPVLVKFLQKEPMLLQEMLEFLEEQLSISVYGILR